MLEGLLPFLFRVRGKGEVEGVLVNVLVLTGKVAVGLGVVNQSLQDWCLSLDIFDCAFGRKVVDFKLFVERGRESARVIGGTEHHRGNLHRVLSELH